MGLDVFVMVKFKRGDAMTLMMFLALVIVLALFVVAKFVSTGKIPPEKGFRCSKCGNYAVHDERTIKAWRNEKHKFFCKNCHRTWLAQNEGNSRTPSAPSKTGCLVLFAVPIFVSSVAFVVAKWI